MATTRPGRLVHLDQHRQAELSGVGRAEHDTYVVTETHDGTLVFTPAPGWTEDHLALLARPDVVELLERDPSQLTEAPIDPPHAALRIASHASRFGRPATGATPPSISRCHIPASKQPSRPQPPPATETRPSKPQQ